MNKLISVGVCAILAVFCSAKEAPPAWINSIDTNALMRLVFDYTNNVIRSEWAGEDKGIDTQLTANLGFQFAVVGDSEVTNRVNAILRRTCDAIPQGVLSEIKKYNYLGPTLQWLVRSTRQGVTNAASYLEVNARKAVFYECDFNVGLLTNMASKLMIGDIPGIVAIRQAFKVNPDYASILPAEPGVDYPDIMPEQTFTTPYGIGIVLRSPEAWRCFRFWVANLRANSKYAWMSSKSIPINAYRYNLKMTPVDGFVEIKISSYLNVRRIDLMVCQQHGKFFGPPTYVSFYYVPYIKRKYDRRMRIEEIEYTTSVKNPPPYDISPIWIPREWTDCYDYWQHDLLGFKRFLPNATGFLCFEYFSNRGEYVLDKDASDRPIAIRKTQYYMEDGMLKYAPSGAVIKLKGFQPRRRGEGKVGWQK